MGRKILTIFTAFALLLAMSVAAYAVPVSAKMVGNGAKASLTVTVDETPYEMLPWVNNSTTEYPLGDHVVLVTIKGNKVEKVLYVGAVAGNVEKGDDDPEILDASKVTREATVTLDSLKGAGFHCGTFGGNGRVWPAAIEGNANNSVFLTLTAIDDTTWELTGVYDVATGKSLGMPVCPKCGKNKWVSFSNKSGIPDGKNVQFQHLAEGDDDSGTFLFFLFGNGETSLKKTVNGQFFLDWAADKDFSAEEIEEILAGISFKAHKVDAKGDTVADDATPYAVGELTLDGMIKFGNVPFSAGWYAIEEKFEDDSLAAEVFEQASILYVEIGDNGEAIGSSAGFDPAGTYHFDKEAYDAALTIEKFPGMGDFHVTDGTDSWSSFCAMFGVGTDPTNPLKAEEGFQANKADVIKAFNYIYDNWGSIDQWPKFAGSPYWDNYRYSDPEIPGPELATKAIAQLVLWSMLDPDGDWEMGPYGSDRFIAGSIDAAVAQTLANYKDATVGNNIIDVVFLAYIDDGGKIAGSQPQLVPVYAPTFNNKTKKDDPNGKLTLKKTVDGKFFAKWASENFDDDVDELLDGISFYAYAVAGKDAEIIGEPVAIGTLAENGEITFDPQLTKGWYAIVEEFAADSLAEEIFDEVDPLYVCMGENGKVDDSGAGFDFEAQYTVIEYLTGSKVGAKIADADGTWKDTGIFGIQIASGDNVYESFCAYGYANYFGNGYEADVMVDSALYAEILGALNYIHDKYGSVDEFFGVMGPSWGNAGTFQTRVLSQVVIWKILHNKVDVEFTNGQWAGWGVSQMYYDAVDDVIANYIPGATGAITNLVYLTAGTNFTMSQPQLVPIYATFNNKTKDDPKGELTLKKTVNGQLFAKWVVDAKVDVNELIEGIQFVATSEDGNFVTIGTLNEDGLITFNPALIPTGWYEVKEELSGLAADIFTPIGSKWFYVSENGVFGAGLFDYDALYTVVNGYGNGYVIGYSGLNNTGDIFTIGVRNVETGIVYPSFCAHGGSRNFAGESGLSCAGYMVPLNPDYTMWFNEGADLSDFQRAYDYIADTYGDLNYYRAVTQIVTWALLGEAGAKGIDYPSNAFDNINWEAVEAGTAAVPGVPDAKGIVEDVLAKYKSHKLTGAVTDVVYLVCEQSHHDPADCQPQLVPIYGPAVFNNKIVRDVQFNKTIYGEQKLIYEQNGKVITNEGFEFELFRVVDGVVEDKPIDTVYSDATGTVQAFNLAPGSYVFREVISTLLWEEGSLDPEVAGGASTVYNLVWTPEYLHKGGDGLYFDITATGDVVWEEGFDGTLNNVVACKHNILWGAGDDFYFSYEYRLEKYGNGNIIFFENNCHGYLDIVEIVPPTCERPGILWLGCSDGCGIGTGLYFGEQLECKLVFTGELTADGMWEWWGCKQPGCNQWELHPVDFGDDGDE